MFWEIGCVSIFTWKGQLGIPLCLSPEKSSILNQILKASGYTHNNTSQLQEIANFQKTQDHHPKTPITKETEANK